MPNASPHEAVGTFKNPLKLDAALFATGDVGRLVGDFEFAGLHASTPAGVIGRLETMAMYARLESSVFRNPNTVRLRAESHHSTRTTGRRFQENYLHRSLSFDIITAVQRRRMIQRLILLLGTAVLEAAHDR